MISRVLIIGGYGNFGSFIARKLALDKNIQLIIAGRSLDKADALIDRLSFAQKPETAQIDVHDGFDDALKALQPNIVIHTSGPFQAQGYEVAKTCIARRCHYIDLSDGREFVNGITSLDAKAKSQDVLVVSGASSVPCLTSALIDHYIDKFEELHSLDYGITTAQRTARGLATTSAILSYTGKPFETLVGGKLRKIYGWQDLRARKYSELGWRLLSNCDVPDLGLFPKRYPTLKNVRFRAGLELPFIHLTLSLLSWLVRARLIGSLEKAAPLMLKISHLFDWLGSSNSAFHMELSGRGKGDKQMIYREKVITFELTARSGDGPYIPSMPAILLAQKLAAGDLSDRGAYPAMGFVTKDEYLGALNEMDIEWREREII